MGFLYCSWKVCFKNRSSSYFFSLQAHLVSILVLFIPNFSGLKDIKRLTFPQLKYLFLIGALMGIALILGSYGLKLSTAINYSFLIKSTLVFTILLAVIFLKESWNKMKAVLLLMFLLGAYLITTQGKTLTPKWGDLLIITSAFFGSSSAILQKPLLAQEVKPALIAFFRAFFASLVLVIVAPFLATDFYVPQGGFYLLFAGVSYGIETLFLSKSLSVATASYMTMMSTTTPVIVSLIGITWLQESLTLFHFLGGGLIIISGVLVNKLKI